MPWTKDEMADASLMMARIESRLRALESVAEPLRPVAHLLSIAYSSGFTTGWNRLFWQDPANQYPISMDNYSGWGGSSDASSYICQKQGYYRVLGTANIQPGVRGYIAFTINEPGTTPNNFPPRGSGYAGTATAAGSETPRANFQLCDRVFMNVGDKLCMWVYCNPGGGAVNNYGDGVEISMNLVWYAAAS